MSQVRQRCVFYVSGFDPKGAAHYHALYRQQAALQAQAGGLAIEAGPRRKLPSGNAAWSVNAMDDGVAVRTWYEFMRWDDVVRAHWPRHQWQLWSDVISTTVFNLRHGALWKMYRLSWPPAFALFMPFMLLCAVLAGMPLLGALTGWALWNAGANVPVAIAAGVVAASLLGWAGLRLEARYSMYWMMRSYAFTARQARGETPDLEARLDAQADRLVERLREGVDDEVLVVGHSSGAIMAAIIVARALQRIPEFARQQRPVLSLLTLGQWIPLLGLLPQARVFRQELTALATAPKLDWVDFSAPPDGCCFALTDPVAGSGLEVPDRAADRPKLLSPRFAQMFDSEAYAALKRDKFRMHFQYLMASPAPAEYDYFRITAGTRTLGLRYAGQHGTKDYSGLQMFAAR
jgi:hypothetical protein